MKVIMVKKRLADGSECRKCQEATDFLKGKGVWDQIDEIVWFDETVQDSPGAALAIEHEMERAPFFVIERRNTPAQAIDSVMRAYRML
jgi:hypothetical protein